MTPVSEGIASETVGPVGICPCRKGIWTRMKGTGWTGERTACPEKSLSFILKRSIRSCPLPLRGRVFRTPSGHGDLRQGGARSVCVFVSVSGRSP